MSAHVGSADDHHAAGRPDSDYLQHGDIQRHRQWLNTAQLPVEPEHDEH